jgi:hypothetical protein
VLKASAVSPVQQAEAAAGFSTGPPMVPQDQGPNNPLQRTGGQWRSKAWWSSQKSVVGLPPPLSGSVRLFEGSSNLVDVQEKKAQQGCRGGGCARPIVQS